MSQQGLSNTPEHRSWVSGQDYRQDPRVGGSNPGGHQRLKKNWLSGLGAVA